MTLEEITKILLEKYEFDRRTIERFDQFCRDGILWKIFRSFDLREALNRQKNRKIGMGRKIYMNIKTKGAKEDRANLVERDTIWTNL